MNEVRDQIKLGDYPHEHSDDVPDPEDNKYSAVPLSDIHKYNVGSNFIEGLPSQPFMWSDVGSNGEGYNYGLPVKS